MPRFRNINTLFQHLFKFGKFIQSTFQRFNHLDAQLTCLIYTRIVKVLNQCLQRVNHIINFDAVDQLSIIAHLCLHSVKFGVELLQVWECPQVHLLNIVPDLLINEEELNDLKTALYLLRVGDRLLKPLFK